MPPDRPLTPTSLPHLDVILTDDGSRTLRDRNLEETFHSGCGALTECWHVYLRNSGTLQRLSPENLAGSSATVRVLEVGFGTGMGWLITAAAAEVNHVALEYVSLEKELLPADVLAQVDTSAAVAQGIHGGWIPETFAVIDWIEQQWLETRRAFPSPATGELIHDVSPTNRLRLCLGDARHWFQHAFAEPFDTIYFDAFSPGTNPELWHEEVFASLKKRLNPGGKLVSYCVNGNVRRALQHAGFEVQRLPGPPGGKREVLCASYAK